MHTDSEECQACPMEEGVTFNCTALIRASVFLQDCSDHPGVLTAVGGSNPIIQVQCLKLIL